MFVNLVVLFYVVNITKFYCWSMSQKVLGILRDGDVRMG